jgi:hypothetical protein
MNHIARIEESLRDYADPNFNDPKSHCHRYCRYHTALRRR